MESETDANDYSMQRAKENVISLSSLAWASRGGVTTNGVKYANASDAIAWGRSGCPLLPRALRESNRGLSLPQQLEGLLGVSISVDQLDADIYTLLQSDTVWDTQPKEFRDFLYDLPIPPSLVVIPAGIPLMWLEDLPISGRTRAAVRRAFKECSGDEAGFLRAPMLAHQFLGIRSVGLTALVEIMCVIESAELGITDEDPTIDVDEAEFQWEIAKHEHLIPSPSLPSARSISTFVRHLREFVSWAIAEANVQVLGEAIEDGRALEVWKKVASTKLTDLEVSPPHAYEVLDRWIDQLEPRWGAILLGRISRYPHRAVTLEELGDRFGVTRERIRQVEGKVRRALTRFLKSEDSMPVHWRASTLRRKLSVAAPKLSVEQLLEPPPGCNDHRDILLDLAGPYDYDGDWLVLRSAASNDPTLSILVQADEVGRIDRESAASRLTEWGLDASLHEKWLLRNDSVRLFNGQVIRWGTSISDRLAFALADINRPATIDEMVAHVSENRARTSIVNALASDPRLVRISRNHWALSSWKLPEYTGIAESMRRLLEESGGSISIDSIVRQMYETFGVEENSTLTYCGAPMFIVEGKSLRLRTKKDHPYLYDSSLSDRTPGVFRLGPKKLGRLLRVDTNMIRGSGMALSHAAGSILEIEVNAHLSFSNQDGDRADITFPETSIAGPSIGSVRRIAERLGAKEGDYLTLVLDGTEMSVAALLTDLNTQSPGWNVIGRLTGLLASAHLGSLAKSIDCDAGEVRSKLQARGDDEILDFLPQSSPSIGLDDALAELESLLENDPWMST